MARRPYFSGNYGSALGSTANAANLLARAGETQGKMFANMGAQIGGMIQQYGLNKEKRDKAEAAFQADVGRLMKDSPQQFVSMQSDPVIGKTLKRIQEGKGSQSDFDKYNAFRAADKEATLQKMQLQQMQSSQIAQQLLNENRRLKNKYEADTLPDRVGVEKAQAQIKQTQAAYAGDQETSTLAARDANTQQTIQKTKQGSELFNLEKQNIEGLIRSRELTNAASLYKLMNIGSPVPKNLEKRFGEIDSQISKIDNSQIKVRNADGDEVTVSFKEYQDNPDDFAPLVSDRLKLLETKKNGLIEEQTNVMLNSEIPYTDPETGEQKFTTVKEKMAYDQIRAKRIQDQRQAKIEENKTKLHGAFNNIPKVPIMNY